MIALTRRTAVAALAASTLAKPALLRAQTSSAPISIGLLSDVGGPYKEVGGPGSRLAAEMAAAEFGIAQGGQRLATLLMMISDILALGQDVCQGLVLCNSFYCDQSAETPAWTDRYAAKMGKPPTEYNAASYAAVTHWLKSAKAANTLDADAVTAKMRELPVNDFYNTDIRIQANGTVPHKMYLWEVKPASQSKWKWDVYNLISTIPSPDAYPLPALFGCPLAGA